MDYNERVNELIKVWEAAREGRKIEAIKRLRSVAAVGLLEAKQIVESALIWSGAPQPGPEVEELKGTLAIKERAIEILHKRLSSARNLARDLFEQALKDSAAR